VSDKPSFLAELKRRNVYRLAVAYAVAAWLLIQVSSILLITTFQAPAWIMKVLVAALALGFPVALAGGALRSHRKESGEQKMLRLGNRSPGGLVEKLSSITVVLAALAAVLFAFRLLRPRPEANVNELERTSVPQLPIVEKGVAILPFANLSDDKANAYFADGIQDEILTKLSHIADLKVISRTSTSKYKSKPEDLRTVAQQLGVANIVEGSVQRTADKVHVTVQLIDARVDAHLWAESLENEGCLRSRARFRKKSPRLAGVIPA
jgi:TolB-like protein